MPLDFQPATNDHDDAVTTLFSELQVRIDAPFWERCFSREAPRSIRSRPFVVMADDGTAAAFGAVRPLTLHARGEKIEGQALHDFIVTPGPRERDAASLLLREIVRLAPLTLSAGAGLEGARLLDQNHFQLVGHFSRLIFDPEKDAKLKEVPKPLSRRTVGTLPENVEDCNEVLEAEQRIFRPRRADELHWLFNGPAGGFECSYFEGYAGDAAPYAVLRTTEGRGGRELLFVDGFCAQVDEGRFAHALAQLATERRMPLHVSVLGKGWARELQESGFRELRPRWPLFWTLRDARQRALGNLLVSPERWFFTAADGETDRW